MTPEEIIDKALSYQPKLLRI